MVVLRRPEGKRICYLEYTDRVLPFTPPQLVIKMQSDSQLDTGGRRLLSGLPAAINTRTEDFSNGRSLARGGGRSVGLRRLRSGDHPLQIGILALRRRGVVLLLCGTPLPAGFLVLLLLFARLLFAAFVIHLIILPGEPSPATVDIRFGSAQVCRGKLRGLGCRCGAAKSSTAHGRVYALH